MKTITLPVFRRPHYFKKVLDSIRAANPKGYVLSIGVEPGCEETVEVARAIDWIDCRAKINKTVLGVDWNNYHLICEAMDGGSSFNVHLEEDVTVSPDAFELADWYEARAGAERDVCMGLVNYDSNPTRPSDVLRTWYFSPIGWCVNGTAWKNFFVQNWMRDKRGWDWSIAIGMEQRKGRSFHPALARSTHIGREGGVHCTPEHHDKTFGKLAISAGSLGTDFKIVGEWQ